MFFEGAGGDDRGDDYDGDEAQSCEEIAHGRAPSKQSPPHVLRGLMQTLAKIVRFPIHSWYADTTQLLRGGFEDGGGVV